MVTGETVWRRDRWWVLAGLDFQWWAGGVSRLAVYNVANREVTLCQLS